MQSLWCLFCKGIYHAVAVNGAFLWKWIYISARPAFVISMNKRFPHSHPFPPGDVMRLGCQARFRLRLRRQSECSGSRVGDKGWKGLKVMMLNVFIFTIHDVDLLCFDAVLSTIFFLYVNICCWNKFLRCTNVPIIFVKDIYVSTKSYSGTLAVISYDDPGQQKIQIFMSQTWKMCFFVCGIVTNRMHWK